MCIHIYLYIHTYIYIYIYITRIHVLTPLHVHSHWHISGIVSFQCTCLPQNTIAPCCKNPILKLFEWDSTIICKLPFP